ncbi:MAG: hypothetical protein FJW38_28565 [Acidobacteria bacterium]|nr:hypothetical protein [Acidobacteriota bacterium]
MGDGVGRDFECVQGYWLGVDRCGRRRARQEGTIELKTPLSSILLVLLASFVGSFGSVFMKAGADRLERSIRGVLTNWRLPVGVAIYLVSFAMYTAAVKSGELTILYPMVSLGYLWTLIWSRLIFNEPLTRNKFIGIGMILLGVVVLNLGNR